MVNALEKRLPKPVRVKVSTLSAAALGLFLGLRYNDYFRKLFERFIPQDAGLLSEGFLLIILTLVVVYASIFIERALDGK